MWTAKVNRNVIDYMKRSLKCAITKNKCNIEAVRASLASIVSHAFGEHDHVEWCGYKKDPTSYKHRYLPRGKPLSGQFERHVVSNFETYSR